MKTIFIFGAGASELAGAPLMPDFLDRAHDLLRMKVPGVIEAEDSFNDVFEAIDERRGIHSKSYLDLNNIEIGRYFGVKGSTVSEALKEVETRIKRDKKYLKEIEILKGKFI